MTTNTQNNQEIDLNYYIGVVFKHFWLLLAITLLVTAAAVAVNTFMRPIYKASVLMMIDKEESGKISNSNLGSWSADEDYYRTQYKLLESRSLLEKTYNKFNLGQYEGFKGGWLALKKNIKIDPITRSRLVNVEVSSYDAQLAANIADDITATFVSENINNRISMAKDIITALESTQRSKQEMELLNSMPQVVNSDFIKNLKQQETELQSQYAKFSAKYTKSHPEVISVQNQLNTINNTIDVETRRLIQSIKIDLSGQFSGNNIRIIDAAVMPQSPYLPRKAVNIAIGIAGGIFLGLLIVFLIEFLDQSIKSAEDLETKLNLPFLGFVPYEKQKQKMMEYSQMLKEGNHLQAESIRNIRTMVNFSLNTGNIKAILTTSSLQGEGKSHMSSNLAVAFAQAGKKVLLIDGDLRRNRLHKIFKLDIERGLSNIWSGEAHKADFAYNIQKTDVKNLSVMTAGIRPPNPAELLNTPLLEAFINWAKANYDLVVVDCPALLPVSDTLLWGRYIDKAIFVVKYGETNAKLAMSAIAKMQKAGINIFGAIIGHYRPGGLARGKYGYYKSYQYYNDDSK